MQRHPAFFVLTVVAAMIVAQYAVDVVFGAYPNSPWIGGMKQAVTGA